MQPTSHPPQKTESIESLISRLYAPKAFYARPIFELITRKEESIPALLKLVRETAKSYEQVPNDRCDFLIALYLLSYFREPLAFPEAIKWAKLPTEQSRRILDWHAHEGIQRWLISTYNGNLSAIKEIIEDEAGYIYARGSALKSLLGLVAQKALPREELIDYYRQLIQSALIKDSEFASFIAIGATHLHPEELYTELMTLFENGRIDYGYIHPEDVDEALNLGKEECLNFHIYSDQRLQPITDIQKNVSCIHIASASNGTPRRNDPCYCGSSKKFKRCCYPLLNAKGEYNHF